MFSREEIPNLQLKEAPREEANLRAHKKIFTQISESSHEERLSCERKHWFRTKKDGACMKEDFPT